MCLYSCVLLLCLTCCHGAAVAACCASCFFDGDPCWCDAHSLPLPRRWSPAAGVRSFIGRAGSAVQDSVTTRAPENTRSSNDGDGSGDGSNGSAAHLLRKTIPTFYISFLLALALSLRFCNALARSVQHPSLSLLHTLSCDGVTQSTFLRSVARW